MAKRGKRTWSNITIITIVLIILVLAIISLIVYNIKGNNGNNNCNYNSAEKFYIKTESNCVVNFLCAQGTVAFSDGCGCGCEKINGNDTDDGNGGSSMGGNIYCTPESRNAQVCTEIYAPVCGFWDPAKIQCIRFPCGQTYSSSCFACANKDVLYYTSGECPK